VKKKKKTPAKTIPHKPTPPAETIVVSKGAAYATMPLPKPQKQQAAPVAPVVDPAILKKYGITRPSKLKNTEWRQQHGIDPTDRIEDL